jgi:hypothetical protein
VTIILCYIGEDGIPGIDGKSGQDAQDAEPQLSVSKVCYNCPAGPPGKFNLRQCLILTIFI